MKIGVYENRYQERLNNFCQTLEADEEVHTKHGYQVSTYRSQLMKRYTLGMGIR